LPALASPLDDYSAPAELVLPLDRGRVRCLACAHRCVVPPEGRGICRVRINRAGTLLAPSGYVSSLNADPVEKKPLYHVLPGSVALTFGMLGCNLHCDFCQNWEISQTLRDERATERFRPTGPEQVVEAAVSSGAKLVVSSYNEPLITSEWAVRIFRLAREAGLRTAYVSNGYASPEALDYIRPWVDALKVDLKAMRAETYRRLGARLDGVLDTIRRAVVLAIWVEVVTLVVPGMNDSPDELRQMADFLAEVSPDLPWHVTAFHPDYRHLGAGWTPAATIQSAAEIGAAAGLHYVYSGNLSESGEWEDTRCPSCRTTLVQRRDLRWTGRRIVERHLSGGRCPGCGQAIPGIWE
jgi:pyruvate formate lyase activating enzyme